MCHITDSGESGKEFFLRRIARIVPLYWLLTLFAFLLAWVKPTLFNSTTADLGNLLRSLFFIPYEKENGSISPIIPVGWTLNYEVYFYLLITFSTVVFGKKWHLLVSLAIMALYLFSNLLIESSDVVKFMSNQIALEFVFGILVHFFNKKWRRKVLSLGAVVNIGIIIGCYSFMALMDVFRIESMRALTLGLPSSIMLLSFMSLESMLSDLPTKVTMWLVEIGNASYATYLSHLYVVEGLRKIVFFRINPDFMYTPIGVALILCAALAVGQILYYMLDRPLNSAIRHRLLKFQST